jgi:predicted PurR-regulated permease PerM
MAIRFKGTYWFLFFSVAFLALAFYFFSDIIAYVLIAFVLSMIGQPVMGLFLNRLQWAKYRWGSPLAAIITLLLMLGIFALLIWLFVPLLLQQAQNIGSVNYGDIELALEEPIRRMYDWLGRYGIAPPPEGPQGLVKDALEGWYKPQQITLYLGNLVTTATSFLIGVFSVAFITFFFLQEKGMFLSFILALVPNQYEAQVAHAMEDIIILLRRYFAGVLLQITIITIIVTLGLSLFGIDNALLIGFFAAVINVIPYIGPLIGATFGVFITISTYLDLNFYAEMLPLLLKVVSVFAIMQLIDNFILQPFIFSTSVLAHPLEIFLVILIAGKIGGIPGMILAIPVYTMIRVIARTFLGEFKIVKKLTDRFEEVDDN